MSDSKISALVLAVLPLGGTEVFPIVQTGITKKVSISDMLAAPPAIGNTTPATGKFTTLGVNSAITSGVSGTASGSLTLNSITSGTPTIAYRNSSNSGDLATIRVSDSTGIMTITDTFGINFSGGNLIQGTAAKGINFTANTPAAGMTSRLLNWYEEGTWTPNQGAGLALVGAFSSSGTYTRVGRQVTVRGQVVGATSVATTAAGVISSNLPFTAAVTHAGSMFNDAVNASGVVQITAASVVAADVIAATPNITFTATYQV
jgi:hypothetical protein